MLVISIWDSEDFDTFEEAKERAREIEVERRQAFIKLSGGRIDMLQELFAFGPKVTIKPVLTEDADFEDDYE